MGVNWDSGVLFWKDHAPSGTEHGCQFDPLYKRMQMREHVVTEGRKIVHFSVAALARTFASASPLERK